MLPPKEKSTKKKVGGYRLIGGFKLLEALLLAAAGFGIFKLLNKDLGTVVDHFVTRLHLDPDNWFVHKSIDRVSGLDPHRLKTIGAGTFFYAALEFAEGIGLVLRKRWASYLTVIATAVFLLPEGYELAHKINAVRIVVLLINLAIVVYLIVKLRQEHREADQPAA